MKRILTTTGIFILIVAVLGCASMSRRDKGALIGAGGGAAAGAAVGKAAGNTALGAILGAMIGGAAGAYIGNYMDKQAAEMERDLQNARIERVGEGIKVTFDSGILFDIDKSSLRIPAQVNLQNLAKILTKYEDTEVLIEGHTDSTGSDEHNMDLSIRRAQTVAAFLQTLNVNSTRFHVMGYGKMQPVASNASAEGRQANRRVDIAIYANGKLKKAAEEQVKG
jgi:outer membrane protein OmpA-like peptidoglycan-associated protein